MHDLLNSAGTGDRCSNLTLYQMSSPSGDCAFVIMEWGEEIKLKLTAVIARNFKKHGFYSVSDLV